MFVIDRNLLPTVVTHEAFSLGSLIAWLETMPSDGKYNFDDCKGHCLLSQYAFAHGEKGDHYKLVADKFKQATGEAWPEGNSRACVIALTEPWTFGAALTRAREYAGKVS